MTVGLCLLLCTFYLHMLRELCCVKNCITTPKLLASPHYIIAVFSLVVLWDYGKNYAITKRIFVVVTLADCTVILKILWASNIWHLSSSCVSVLFSVGNHGNTHGTFQVVHCITCLCAAMTNIRCCVVFGYCVEKSLKLTFLRFCPGTARRRQVV